MPFTVRLQRLYQGSTGT